MSILVNRLDGLAINSIQELNQMGALLAKSGFFTDAKSEAQCAVKILCGIEMGISAFAAMTGIHIVKGKPTAGANIMAMKIKSHPAYDYRVLEMSSENCEIEFFQNGDSIGVSEFSLADAKKAGTQNLDKFARNMLFARAISNGVRWYCPDAMGPTPVYTPEEMGVAVDGDGGILDIQSVSVEPVDSRDWTSVLNRISWPVAKLKETALANSLPASSNELTPEQSDALFEEVLTRLGQESGVFKASAHCKNSLNKIEASSDSERIEAWLQELETKKQPAPALD